MRKWLKQIRTSKGLSQAEAAKLSGITQQYYSFIESGIRGDKLPVKTAKSIADALGFQWEEFYSHVSE